MAKAKSGDGGVWVVWTTYRYYPGSQRFAPRTQLESERAPTIGVWEQRPATEAEIRKEKRERRIKQVETEKRIAFENRPDYRHAQAIRSALEMMDHSNNPLDNLTPDEWAELRRRCLRESTRLQARRGDPQSYTTRKPRGRR